MNVHIFTGSFKDIEEALAYTEQQWEDEPDEDASDEEFEAWEENNPTWKLRQDLGCYLDPDFIETGFSPNISGYLESILPDPSVVDAWREELDAPSTALVLIFEKALYPEDDTFMRSTGKLQYKGKFASNI